MAAELRLPVLSLPGLSPDSLGNYLASLGLLRILTRKWPSTRIAWRDEVLQVVGGPPTLDGLLDELVRVADMRAWSPYVREWNDARLRSAKEGGHPLTQWAAVADEGILELFGAHIVPHGDKRSINPVLGKLAGAIGRRDFAAGWDRAVSALETAAQKPGAKRRAAVNAGLPDERRRELQALFLGRPVTWLLEKLNGATWFSQANKLYNSGQRPSREGLLSPWLMALACEGLGFLSGGTSRRFGSSARTKGAFPFVTRGASATTSQAADRDAAEFWAPLWSRPMTHVEVVALFRRGRAELSGRSATIPAAFAASIRQRGVDAGIQEFRRFVLGWTTAHDYTETRFEGAVAVPNADTKGAFDATPDVLRQIASLIEQPGFPRDGKRFAGVRGPIETALLDVAAEPSRSDANIALLDAITTALDRIDRNRGFREGKVWWAPLPLEWLPSLFADEQPGVEARLALSLVSSFAVAQPFATFRFGVEWKYGRTYARYTHVERPPARWVWGPGELARGLGVVLSRRLLDQKAETDKLDRGGAPFPATISQVRHWLMGEIDESLFSAWLSRLALFDWRRVPQKVRALIPPEAHIPGADSGLALLGLMQPLVDQRTLIIQGLSPDDLLSDETGVRTTEAARSLVTLIRAGSLDAAFRLAGSRYAMVGARLASFDAPFDADDPDRLVAALLFTISDRDRTVLFERWLRPRRRQQGGEAHA